MTENQFNSINDLLKENKNVITFIKDYILRFRFADIACHSIDNQTQSLGISFGSTEDVNNDYIKDADEIIDEYNNEVKKICDKDRVKTYCENDNLKGIKDELDQAKYLAYEKIIKQYNGVDGYRYTSGKRSDFMISDLYLSYITDEDFVYDDENPYVVELVYNIETFLNTRKKIENTSSNVASSIVKFNQMCDEAISQYWSANKKDYYSDIKEKFQFYFYANNDTELIEAKINDENRVTLYSKVLDYLKTMTKYVSPSSAADKYKDMSTDDLMSGKTIADTAEETENEAKLKKLKKIALQFTYLKKLESDVDPKFFEEFISEENLKDLFTLESILSSMNMTLDDYNSACQINNTLINYSGAVAAYMGSLKGITQNEARILRELSDRAVDWYKQNAKSIDNGSIFEQFMEVKWPSPSIIHKDGVAHNFFYIEEPQTMKEQMNNAGGNKDELLKGYEFTEDSLITEYGIDSYNYWLRYCTVATLVNCMLPMYWSTGLIISGAPIPLPIIFIPIVVLSSRVTLVIGLGICGICPLPMLYFVNVGDLPGFLIPTLNILVDMLRQIPNAIMESGNKSIQGIIKGLVQMNDKKIDEKTEEIENIDRQITNLRNGVAEDKEVLRAMKKKLKKDSTSNTKKNGA